MTITHKLSIDLAKRECTPQIDAVQNDYGRSLSLLLHTNGIPWPIPTNITAVIRYCRNDGTGGEYDTLSDGSCAWSAVGNTLTISLAPQVLTVAGDVALSILLTDGEQAISTFDISLYVHTSVSSRISRSDNYINRSEAQTFSEDALAAIGSRIIRGDISSIVLLGDSITAGIDNSSYPNDSEVDPTHYCWANAFKKFVEERYGIHVRNLGIYGSLMDAQKTAALNILTKDDFVIWLTGTNDRNNPESFKANLLSCLNAVKDKCGGLLLISGIPSTEADENSHQVTMQKMDEIVMGTVFGLVPHFSMYQAFTAYCELHDIELSDCFTDHVHPNHLGYYIMFRILCQKLNLPLDPYTDYRCESFWWSRNYLDGIKFLYGYINYITGSIVPRNDVTFGIYEKEYIVIEPGKAYTVNVENAVVSSGEPVRVGIKYYRQDQSYTGIYVDDAEALVPYTFTVPSDIDAEYLRLSFVAGYTDSVSIDWSNAVFTMKKAVE